MALTDNLGKMDRLVYINIHKTIEFQYNLWKNINNKPEKQNQNTMKKVMRMCIPVVILVLLLYSFQWCSLPPSKRTHICIWIRVLVCLHWKFVYIHFPIKWFTRTYFSFLHWMQSRAKWVKLELTQLVCSQYCGNSHRRRLHWQSVLLISLNEFWKIFKFFVCAVYSVYVSSYEMRVPIHLTLNSVR